MQKLVIDRRVWLRGEGCKASYLLRAVDNKMCCIGIYMKSLGFTAQQLKNQATASEVILDSNEQFKEAKCDWLVMSGSAGMLYDINDDPKISEAERETKIAEGFAHHGVKVTFVDKLKRTVKKAKAAVKRRRKAK